MRRPARITGVIDTLRKAVGASETSNDLFDPHLLELSGFVKKDDVILCALAGKRMGRCGGTLCKETSEMYRRYDPEGIFT